MTTKEILHRHCVDYAHQLNGEKDRSHTCELKITYHPVEVSDELLETRVVILVDTLPVFRWGEVSNKPEIEKACETMLYNLISYGLKSGHDNLSTLLTEIKHNATNRT